jgi:hypothetical protein
MKLKLEAISPAEGTGIVRVGQMLRLLRPPYQQHGCPVLPEDALRDAILTHGFSPAEMEFEGWGEVISYLDRGAIESRRAAARAVPDSFEASELLELAPIEVLEGFLERTEKTLIPQRLFEHAENFLLKLLASKAPDRHPGIRSRAAKLLQRNKEARERTLTAIYGLAARDARFSSLEKHGQLDSTRRLADQVRERQSVLTPVG